MSKTELQSQDSSVEPEPRFATDAEIALAEQLRIRLEERYFGPSATHSPLHPRSGDIH